PADHRCLPQHAPDVTLRSTRATPAGRMQHPCATCRSGIGVGRNGRESLLRRSERRNPSGTDSPFPSSVVQATTDNRRGALQVRLTKYPLAMGIVAGDVDDERPSPLTSVLAEYYTFRAPGEPKFVLTRSQDRWLKNLVGEAEAIWNDAIAPADWDGDPPRE